MDQSMFLFVLSLVLPCIIVLIFTANYRKSAATNKLPPGPRPMPIIGNLFQVGNSPHRSLFNLSKTYGPLMSLKLGSVPTIVISSPEIAKQVLQKYGQHFSNRTIPDTTRGCDHHKFSLVWLPVSDQWRNLRKICTVLMFSTERLNSSEALRCQKVQQLMDHVQESCNKGQIVNIGRAAFTTSLNLLSNTLFSTDIAHHRSSSSQEFKDLAWSILGLGGIPNISDFFPVLRFLDLQGLRRRASIEMNKLLGIFDDIVKQRMQLRASSSATTNNDVLDALLNLINEKSNRQFGCNEIKHLFLDLFVAGTDTTSSTLEWAMAELLHNPGIMAKAKTELQQVICNDKPIQEIDISSLPYLQAVVKETLRLHPPTPLLLPHEAEIDVEINGFTVPKDARLLVNVWAFGRDPKLWTDPNSFIPDRFLESELDVKGRDFELIPFGTGRRICPGMSLANRMLHLMLASLLHSFNWELENGLEPEHMDMSDKMGMTVQMTKPLRAIPIKV